ncbi:MAG: GspE/PulE family protein [Calditrichia bacterium]
MIQDNMYKLGMSLVKRDVLPFETLERALKFKQTEPGGGNKSLAHILVSDFEIDHDMVFKEVAQLYGFKHFTFTEEMLTEDRIEFIRKVLEPLPESTRELMVQEQILVVQHAGTTPLKHIFVATDPTNKQIPNVARAVGAKRYEICYISPDSFVELLDKVMPRENEFLKMMEDGNFEIDVEGEDEGDADEQAIEAEINKSILVNLVEGMLIEAVRQKASDIHVIPKDATTTEIHFRIDGRLRLWHSQSGVRPESLSAVVKDRSRNVDRFEREMSQDGFIQRTIDGHTIRYRVSVVPIVGKVYKYKLESIVIRILDDRNVITDLDALGFHGSARDFFVKAISQPQGMVIVTGPTGSGKSTTLIAALSYIVTSEINVLTVEDPVEYVIPGVRQLKISGKNNFDQALRAILRHDPDVVMVGEMRDKKTAETAIKLSNTGHLTFSTLHTNDAPSAVSRLFKMGVETFLIAYAINIIIAQRLLRRLCKNCKRKMGSFDHSIALRLGFTEDEINNTTFYEPVGCDQCHNGYRGRAAIHEALYFSKEIRQMIFESGKEINEVAIKNLAIKQGMLTLRASARERVKEGSTSFEEVAKTTNDD